MQTECIQQEFEFQALFARRVVSKFDGGSITSDGGGLLLREVDQRFGLIEQFSRCFTDHRSPVFIEHTVSELVGQRVIGLALGYEDLCDHDDLRSDPLLATLAGKADPTGQSRSHERDRGAALAGKSTLNRMELTPADATPQDRYKKIVAEEEKIERYFVDVFLQLHSKAPKRIVLDLDATDDPVHGEQEGRFFHGYYMHYCYLPLYLFCGDHLLVAKLRPSNIDASKGAVAELERVVTQIRAQWPEVEIVIRGDSGFCREEIMSWCESNTVGYVLGLARNSRLVEMVKEELEEVRRAFELSGRSARMYTDFQYQTRDTWSRSRRVIGKAEHLSKGSNPRFVVTSIPAEQVDARTVYEREYCARGEMENRIKEQQLGLFADRTSTSWMRSNQLRLWFSSVAYVLMNALRVFGLAGTEMARAQCSTMRVKLLKIGACVTISIRRVLVSLSSSYPYRAVFAAALRNLRMPVPCRV
jgi:hypothetical protein